MPFKKVGSHYESPSGRHYNQKQVALWYAGGGKFPGEKGPGEISGKKETNLKKYAKGGDVHTQEDRARGGPVITTRSKFLKTPDVFRTDTERNEYGPKSGKGGELAETEGDTKSQKPVKPRG